MERFYGAVTDGRLVLDARQAFLEAVRGLDGKLVVLELRQSRSRSNQQNRYYWGAVLPIVQDGMKAVGVSMSIEQVHELMKYKFLQIEYVTNDGEIIQSIGSSKELSPPEFNEYIERIQQWASEYLGITIPDPNEQITIFDK